VTSPGKGVKNRNQSDPFSNQWLNVQQVADEKDRQISRVMDESLSSFNHQVTANQYIALYENMLQRPFVFHEQMRAAS